eukprot:EG_transcript_33331
MYGPGLEPGALKVGQECRINFKFPPEAGQGPLKAFVQAELAPNPLKVRDRGVGLMEVVFIPRCPGKHTFEFQWGASGHIPGSPIDLEVTGEAQRDPKKVRVVGDSLDGGNVGEPMVFEVAAPDEAGPGPLEVDMSGPCEPDLELAHVEGGKFRIEAKVSRPGEYKMSVWWGGEGNHVAGSPFTIEDG